MILVCLAVECCCATGSRAFPSDAAQRPAESAQGQLEPSSASGHMAHPSMLEAQHDSASNLHGAVPSFMASLLPQVSQSVLAEQVVVLVLSHITYTCAFKPGCLMSHNWLHNSDCKV